MVFKVIGKDWKGFNAACYKKDNQVENIGLPEIGVNSDSDSDPLIVRSGQWVVTGWV